MLGCVHGYPGTHVTHTAQIGYASIWKYASSGDSSFLSGSYRVAMPSLSYRWSGGSIHRMKQMTCFSFRCQLGSFGLRKNIKFSRTGDLGLSDVCYVMRLCSHFVAGLHPLSTALCGSLVQKSSAAYWPQFCNMLSQWFSTFGPWPLSGRVGWPHRGHLKPLENTDFYVMIYSNSKGTVMK